MMAVVLFFTLFRFMVIKIEANTFKSRNQNLVMLLLQLPTAKHYKCKHTTPIHNDYYKCSKHHITTKTLLIKLSTWDFTYWLSWNITIIAKKWCTINCMFPCQITESFKETMATRIYTLSTGTAMHVFDHQLCTVSASR